MPFTTYGGCCTVEQLAAEVIDLQGFAFGRIPVFVEDNSPKATGGSEETFDLERED